MWVSNHLKLFMVGKSNKGLGYTPSVTRGVAQNITFFSFLIWMERNSVGDIIFPSKKKYCLFSNLSGNRGSEMWPWVPWRTKTILLLSSSESANEVDNLSKSKMLLNTH